MNTTIYSDPMFVLAETEYRTHRDSAGVIRRERRSQRRHGASALRRALHVPARQHHMPRAA